MWAWLVVVSAIVGCRGGFDPILDGDVDAAASVAPSCSGLAATCGASAGSCCESPTVPGGTFARGFDVSGDGMYGVSSFPATVSDFRLDRYEVTVGRFRAFVVAGAGTAAAPPTAGAGAHPHVPGSGWDPTWSSSLPPDAARLEQALGCDPTFATWTHTPGANEHRPITCVSWYEAAAFCAWDGGFLPTEAEWEYAAAGGNEQRAFPWSSPPQSLAVDTAQGTYGCMSDPTPGCQVTDLVDVGSKPAGDGRWRHADLGGNVWEWTLDYNAAYTNPCTDCANLTPGINPVIHGGSYDAAAGELRGGFRGITLVRTDRPVSQGVRCAR